MTRKVAARANPRDAEATKSRLMDAASALFATKGFGQSGVREIAAMAGVDIALVNRYFGSKEGLFRACVESKLHGSVATGDPRSESFGQQLLMHMVSKDDSESDLAMMLLLAAGDATVGEMARDILDTYYVKPLSERLAGTKRYPRAALITLLLSGFWIHRRALPLKPFTGAVDADVRRWFVAAVDALRDGID